ncbi:MAG: tetratricopeptide repeat protein [Bryobacteraceae bacterium]
MIPALALLFWMQAIDTTGPDQLYAAGEFQKAAGAYRDLLMKAPQDPMLLTRLGACEYQLGRFQQAEDAFRKAVSAAPELPPALVGLGTSLITLGRSKEAVPVLEKAMKLNPEDVMARRALGHAYQEQERFVEGEAVLRSVLKENPRDAESWYYLGVLFFERKYAQSALDALDKALAVQPGNFRAKLYRAAALVQLGRTQEAESAFTSLGRIPGALKDPEYLAEYALLLYHTNRSEAALEKIDQALAVAPESPKLHFWRARMLLAKGELSSAAAAAKKSVELGPDLPNARNLLLRIYRLQGNNQDAARMAAWLRNHSQRNTRGAAR